MLFGSHLIHPVPPMGRRIFLEIAAPFNVDVRPVEVGIYLANRLKDADCFIPFSVLVQADSLIELVYHLYPGRGEIFTACKVIDFYRLFPSFHPD